MQFDYVYIIERFDCEFISDILYASFDFDICLDIFNYIKSLDASFDFYSYGLYKVPLGHYNFNAEDNDFNQIEVLYEEE